SEDAQAKVAAGKLRDNPATAQVGYLLLAKLAFEERDKERGTEYLTKARELDPSNAALAVMVSKLKTAEGDFEGVLDVGGDVLDVSQFRGEARETVTNALYGLAKAEGPARALERVDEMLAAKPNDLTLRILKVDFLLQSDRFADAMRELEDAERKDPDNPNIPRLKAQAMLSQGHFKPALVEIERVLEADPANVPSLLLAAQAALGAGDYRAAGGYADRARKENLDAPEGYVLMAEALRKMDRVPAAISVLQAYTQRKPEDFAIYVTLAELQRDAGRTEDAIATLRRARSRQPGDVRYLQSEVELLLKSNRKAEAQVLARDYFASKQIPAEMMAVAQAFADYKETVDAQHWAEKALAGAKINERPKINSFLGTIFMRRGMQEGNPSLLEKARDHFAAAIDEQPFDIVAANNLAWLLAMQFDRAKEAVEVLEKARNKAPVEQLPVQFIDTLALAYTKADYPQRATKLLKEGVTYHPREPQLLYQLAMLLADAQPVQAKDMLKRAIELGLAPEDEENARRQIARL
ncbi:MAG: tetratricopeptide repeat protein, partial [Planctomycetales bacterium]|nr:tetratricopeptide repeat protein [Planctomycetales bacterium]